MTKKTPVLDIDIQGEKRGEWFTDRRRGYINPKECEGMRDFLQIIRHEYIHQILSDEFGTTAEQDHWVINIIDWEDIYLDGEVKDGESI